MNEPHLLYRSKKSPAKQRPSLVIFTQHGSSSFHCPWNLRRFVESECIYLQLLAALLPSDEDDESNDVD